MSLALASRRAAISPAWAKNSLWRTARAVPSLDLPFADNKSLTDAVTGQSLVTFTRASSGTYVDSTGTIRTATTNEARFDHNPVTGESLGLLVEEQRTNNLVQSEDFSTTWTTSNLTVTTNSVVAPDGATTADTISPPTDGLTATRFLRQSPALTTQGAYTFSVFVKVGTATTNGIALYVSDQTSTNNFRANFNLFSLTSGAASNGWATPTSAIIPYPNGWYRCILSGVTSTAHTSLRAQVYLGAFGNVADSYGSIHIWGAQLEAGAFPTSYIPTTTAAATRSADVASITGSAFSSWYRQDEGTFYASARAPQPTGVNRRVLFATDGGTNNRVGILYNTSNVSQLVVSASGSLSAAISSAVTPTDFVQSAGAYALNSFGFSANGTAIAPDVLGDAPTGIYTLSIGSSDGGDRISGHIKRVVFWPRRLPDFTLQALTQ